MSRIIPVLETYRRNRRTSYYYAVRDLLTDIMHYCDANGINFENKLQAARDVWSEEKTVEMEPFHG